MVALPSRSTLLAVAAGALVTERLLLLLFIENTVNCYNVLDSVRVHYSTHSLCLSQPVACTTTTSITARSAVQQRRHEQLYKLLVTDVLQHSKPPGH